MFGKSDCSIRDHFEATVSLHYQVKVTLRSGTQISGVATNLRSNKDRNECLELSTDQGLKLIEIDEIVSVEVTSPNPRFSSIPIAKHT